MADIKLNDEELASWTFWITMTTFILFALAVVFFIL
jgi:hypothetical protein